MLTCEVEKCGNERAPKQMLCFHHWWGEYNQSPRHAAEKLFEEMDIVTQDSSAEVGLMEYAIFQAEKRALDGKMPFSMTPAEINQLKTAGVKAQQAFNELCSAMGTITNRLESTLNRFHASMAECGVIKEQTRHGPVYLIKDLQKKGILPKIDVKVEKDKG